MNLSQLLYYSEKQTGALINIDALHPAFYAADALELAPEQHVHRGGFCEFAKRHGHDLLPCHETKARTRSIAAAGEPFHGTCPHGVWELVWPLTHDRQHVGTLYLGNFASGSLRRRIGDAAFDGVPPRPRASADLPTLRKHAAFIAEYARIEIELWLADGKNLGKQKPGAFYRDFCVEYIERNYREDIQLADLAAALHMTPNYLSERIKTECGRTFRQLLTEKRLQVAKTYLEFEAGHSISDIAFMCGFRDSNYFSTVFRRQLGISPRAYRKGPGRA